MSLLIKKVLQGIKNLNENKADKVNITTGVEFKTGRIIDGKEECGKRINCGYLPDNGHKEIVHDLTNITLIKYEAFGKSPSGGLFNFPFINLSTQRQAICQVSVQAILLDTNYDLSGYVGYVDLYYIKN